MLTKYCFAIGLVLITPITYAEPDTVNPYQAIQYPYSARLISYNKYRPLEIDRSQIVVTQDGVRIAARDMYFDGHRGIYLQHFATNTAWAIHPPKKIAAELPDDDDTDDFISAGIMSTSPCSHTDEIPKSIDSVQQTPLDEIVVWKCQIDDEFILQHFSESWQMVIKEEWPDGNIMELQDIKNAEFDSAYFLPPDAYREVTLEEFYTGSPPLKKFSED